MGMSPSADLFYGYDLEGLLYDDDYNDLRPQWWQDDDDWGDWEKALARKLGWVEVPYPNESAIQNLRHQTTSWEERERLDEEWYATPEYKAWSASLDMARKLAGRYSCSLDSYGYCEDPSIVVRINNQGFRAWDYGSCEVDVTKLEVDPTWDAKLAEFVELLEIKIPDGVKPGWHLTCSYG